MSKDLTALFAPRSVAIVGASASPEKLGAIVLKNIQDSQFPGPIYPINPNHQSISGLTCYKDIASLPELPDLVVLAVPASVVMQILPEIGEAGIKNVLVFAAGFKEIGEEGKKLEEELKNQATKYGINLLGPNCLGFVNNFCPINATFGEAFGKFGNLRFISQSGAIASSLIDWCKSTSLGFSEFITLGNKAVIDENDVLEYWQQTPLKDLPTEEGLSSVHPIGLYLESVTDGQKFWQLAKTISKTDPIFIIKPGKTSAAAKAMQSHTGAIAGEDAVLGAALSQAGVIRCQTLEDFFDFSRAFAWEEAPRGPKVAIISNAGGPAVISADAVVEAGLELPELDESAKKQLEEILPRSASVHNPVDVLGDALAERFGKACEIVLQADQVQSVIIILTPQVMTQVEETAEYVGALSRRYRKPIFCSFIGGSLVAEGEQILNRYKIPSFRYPERAITAIGAMWQWRKYQQKPEEVEGGQMLAMAMKLEKVREIVKRAVDSQQQALDNLQSNEVLSAANIPTPTTKIAGSLEEAKVFVAESGWPVVLKLSSPGLLHKKVVGGVITSIGNQDQLTSSWEKLQQSISLLEPEMARQAKIQIQKEVPNGVEVIVGVKRDPNFGPVLLFGAGGSWAEIIGDRNLYLLPLEIPQARKLMERSKVFSLLKAKNTQWTFNLDKLSEMLVRLGKVAQAVPEISEIEMNPLIVTRDEVWGVDAKVVLNSSVVKSLSTPIPQLKEATVGSKTILAGNFHYIELETATPIEFKPGQYISMKIAPQKMNCYSIAGSNAPNRFNILVDTTNGGAGSKFVENLQVGEKVNFFGPMGNFTLQMGDGARHLLFIATGCGFAPLKCMIEAVLRERPYQRITLYLSFRCADEVFGEGYLQKISQTYPNFQYKLTVDKSNESWQGEVGFVTELIKKDFFKADDCAVYLCGNPLMMTEASKLLQSLGCLSHRIYHEKY